MRTLCPLGLLLICSVMPGPAATVSPLFARGYTVLPSPQKVALRTGNFEFNSGWRVELGPGVQRDDIAVSELNTLLAERFHLSLRNAGNTGNVLRLMVAPHTVEPRGTTDREQPAIAEQAYRMTLAPGRIEITANASAGLFYGVGTLVQLLKAQNGTLWLPEGTINDWPDLQLRIIYWDDAHHLEHLDVLKAAVRQAAFYKINGFSIKLEGHFQYEHAKPVVEPYALSSAELQELTDFGRRYHVEVIPYLDGPAHDAFILKHPEYAALREYADSNYEFCSTNPQTYQLLEGMFDDLLAANKGGKYFVLSTDESYYIGLAASAQCQEAERAKELGGVGKLLAEFVTKTGGYLHDRGRKVIFWGEYPMKPNDIGAVPNYMINGEVYGPEFDPEFKARGIRQLIFTSTVGWKEYLFPNYYLLPQTQHLPGPTGGSYEPVKQGPGVVDQMFDYVSYNPARKQADLMGTFVAGWADVGLHPETMWLGYATGSAAAWRAGSPEPQESMGAFYRIFYGPGAVNMGRLYQLMSEQGQFWKESWDVQASVARSPIWGDWDIIYKTPRPAEDQTLPPLPVPSMPLLTLSQGWEEIQNKTRLTMAGQFLVSNDELLDLLRGNELQTEFQKYNLEVFYSIAQLYRQNLQMLLSMQDMDFQLQSAKSHAAQAEANAAVAALDHALDIAQSIRRDRNDVLDEATGTWYRDWFPRVQEANGRTFLNRVDDVKDHLPVRTADMSYLIYRELLYPFDKWADQTLAVRNEYAGAHGLATRSFSLKWKSVGAAE